MYVAEAGRLERGLGRGADDGGAGTVELENGGLSSRADVVDVAGSADGREQRTHDVADVDEVACLLPVAEDRCGLAGGEALKEDRSNAAFEGCLLARAEHVAETQDDVVRAVDPVPRGQVLLRAKLRDAIRRHRPEGGLLRGSPIALAVDRPARGGEDHLGARVPGCFEDGDRAHDVDLCVAGGFAHRRLNIGLGREVEDDVGASRVDAVADVSDGERCTCRKVLTLPRREVINNGDRIASRQERVDEVRSDEAGSAGDYSSHGPYRRETMFISFEGVDGSGKSTQAGLLASALREAGFEVIETREPGGTPLGEQVRTMLLHGADMTPWAEAALFAASRAQHVEAVIRPALERGAWVVCDRYVDSSVVYQGVVRGLGAEAVYDLNRVVTRELMPQQTFVLDLDAATSRARQDGELDRIEREDDSFRARVVAAYRDLASRDPERVVVLDASLPVAELAERIRERVLAG